MKGIVNRKGFTLTEILVVIALIGVLLLFVMPNLVKIFSNSVKGTMKVQEKEIEDAALIYLDDYCTNKIGNNICPGTITRGDNKKYSGYINLQTLVNKDYIDEVSLQGVVCSGCVIYTSNKAKAYLSCSDLYETDTNVDFKSTCNLN